MHNLVHTRYGRGAYYWCGEWIPTLDPVSYWPMWQDLLRDWPKLVLVWDLWRGVASQC